MRGLSKKRFLGALVDHPYIVIGSVLLIIFIALQEIVDLGNESIRLEINTSIEKINYSFYLLKFQLLC